MSTLSIVAFIIFVISYFGYHFIYFRISELSPDRTSKGRMSYAIEDLFKKITGKEEYILIVHQLRNQIMGVTFIATTCVLLLGLLLNFVGIRQVITEFPKDFTPADFPVWIIILALGYSLINSMLSLRYFTHLTILIRSSDSVVRNIEGFESIEYYKRKYVKANEEYLLARRGILYGFVALSWYLDVWIFIALTIFLTLWLALGHDF